MTPLEAALDYCQRGWWAIPLYGPKAACKAPGKQPLYPAWQITRLAEENLARAWNGHPTANVGIVLGHGLVGLDIDGPGGETILHQLADGDLPETLSFTTGKGRRLLYTVPDMDCRNSDHKAPDGSGEVRILADRRQTVMPPSIHSNGAVYQWYPGASPADISAAPAPEWLIQLLKPQKDSINGQRRQDASKNPDPELQPGVSSNQRHGDLQQPQDKEVHGSSIKSRENARYRGRQPGEIDRARIYLAKCDPAISGQNGHGQTLKIAVKLVKGFGLSPEIALQLLVEDYNPRCMPPWSERELAHKVNEAAKQANPEGFLRDQQRVSPQSETVAKDHPGTGETIPPIPAKKKIAPEIIAIKDLMAMEFPPPVWAIEGYICEGVNVMAGPPKIGKSWLTLHFALAVAYGGTALGAVTVEKGKVLYLALEDHKASLQDRCKLLFSAGMMPIPEDMDIAVRWPRTSDGGIEALREWKNKNPAARLIVIDTLKMVRDKKASGKNGNQYDEDYEAIEPYHNLAKELGIAILIVHHTRKEKGESEDAIDSVSGTQALAGAADAVFVLKRQRCSKTGTLFMTGRSVKEREVKLVWVEEQFLWQEQTGVLPESALPADKRRTREFIREMGRPCAIAEIMPAINKSEEATKSMLSRMVREGLLRRFGHGRYGTEEMGNHPDILPMEEP